MAGSFAQGIDLADDSGLFSITRSVGLPDEEVRAALADESWRALAEQNRVALLEAGLWGAPTFRVNGGPGALGTGPHLGAGRGRDGGAANDSAIGGSAVL